MFAALRKSLGTFGLVVRLTLLAVLALGAFATGRAIGQDNDQPPAGHPPAALNPAAPTGSTFTYQGNLKDDGVPYTGTCDFDFYLFDDATAGNQISSNVLLANVAVSSGTFTVQLDFGSDAFTGEARWLEVGVRCPAGGVGWITLEPRQPLTAAPYAHSLRPGAIISSSADGEATLSLSHSGDGTALRVDPAGLVGIFVNAAGGTGVSVGSPGADGVYVQDAGINGVNVFSANDDGVQVLDAGGNGVRVDHADGDGFFVCSTGSNTSCTPSVFNNGFEVGNADFGVVVQSATGSGVWVGSVSNDGVYANTEDTNSEWGFNTPDKIQASNVTLSSITLVAQVGEEGALRPGDVVAVVGMADPLPDSTEPLAMVVPAGTANKGVAGVVDGRMVLEAKGQGGGPVEDGPEDHLTLRSAPGAAQPGDHVALTIAGAAQVRVSPGISIVEGQRMTVAADGMARPLRQLEVALAAGGTATMMEQAPTLGVALSEPDEDGMAWVLVNPQ